MIGAIIDGNVYIPPTKGDKTKITEITLPIEELFGREKVQQNVVLPETTDVPYVTSINVENEYMEKIQKYMG